jgi:leucyl aminopeptidase
MSETLQIELATAMPDPGADDLVAICVFADEPRLTSANNANEWDALLADVDFPGKEDTSALLHRAGNGPLGRRVVLIGCGEHADVGRDTWRRAAGTAVRVARGAQTGRLYFPLPESAGNTDAIAAAAEGAVMGTYENGFYKKREGKQPRLDNLTLVTTTAVTGAEEAVRTARIVAEAANWTRHMADEPGASLPPEEFARRAAEMAAEVGLKVESLDSAEIQRREMGGLWGVGKGSDQPPALIVLRYEPEAPTDNGDLLAFVGKGITFDTGGISIKHGLDMWEMKSDMTGGATVLGAMRAIAQLKPNRRVVGIVPAAENMPSGKALKPGDVIKSLAGYMVEVIDTDAEGRLVLIDGIAYAKELGATRIVDAATLTGSIIVALGSVRTGLFSNNDEWAGQVTAASERAGEKVWRMPVSDDYKKKIESDIADFKNYGGRPDATGAALLLSKFAGDTPWVHLDIAGTAWYDDKQSYAPKGASGLTVRTLVNLAMDQ